MYESGKVGRGVVVGTVGDGHPVGEAVAGELGGELILVEVEEHLEVIVGQRGDGAGQVVQVGVVDVAGGGLNAFISMPSRT